MPKARPKKLKSPNSPYPKSHTFAGVRYSIDLWGRPFKGMYIPHGCDGEVIISKPLGTRMGMDVALHEGIHLLCPNAKEAAVNMLATELMKWMWHLGYRYDKNGQPKVKVAKRRTNHA